jgi:hypothetical protein
MLLALWVGGAVGVSAQGVFWSHWGDGRAELNGYELVQTRYGELRKGQVVLVYVTEPYSRGKKVKVDQFDPSDPDHVNVLKLNAVRKFQTGVYDYSVMTSLFADPEDEFRPLEISFSMQEWCGHVYEENHFDELGAEIRLSSYFEGETGSFALPYGRDLVAEDALLVTLRGLAADELQRKDETLTLLGSATHRRLNHLRPVAFSSELSWSERPRSVKVPAGRFEVYEATYDRQDGSRCEYQVEAEYPHRIIGWSCSDGEVAQLTGSTRLDYWRTNREGDERWLRQIGFEPEPAGR